MKTKTILAAILFLALGAHSTYAQVIVSPDDTICLGGSTILTVSGGLNGNSLQFDGVDDHVITSVLDLSSGNTMTIEAWVYPTDIASNFFYSFIRQNAPASTPDFLLAFQNNGAKLAFGVYTTAYSELDVLITASNYTDGWHHIAAVYDGATQKLYVDGTEVGSQSNTGNIRLGTGTIMRIGSNLSTTENYEGQLDEIRIWNIARTQSEIINSMFTTIAGNTSGLLAYWRLDECSDTTAADATGNGNDGTLINDPTWVVSSTAPLNPYFSYSWSPATGLSSTTGSTVTASPVTSTTYTVALVGVDTSCAGQTVIVTVNPLPTVSFSGLDTIYCLNDAAVTLIGTPSGGIYSGPGINVSQFDPAGAGLGTHVIGYYYTDGNGCMDSVSQNVTVNNCTGIADIDFINSINIYPNPNSGEFTLFTNYEFNPAHAGRIMIYDVLGGWFGRLSVRI
ncbi:LamG domain-containing protein [bacterium AH-315-M05]|nr:LamG domain-containing protein [bacterium AH-315-M05]